MISSVYAEEPGCTVSAREPGAGRAPLASDGLLLIVCEGKSSEKLPNTANLGTVRRERGPGRPSRHGAGGEAGSSPEGLGDERGSGGHAGRSCVDSSGVRGPARRGQLGPPRAGSSWLRGCWDRAGGGSLAPGLPAGRGAWGRHAACRPPRSGESKHLSPDTLTRQVCCENERPGRQKPA